MPSALIYRLADLWYLRRISLVLDSSATSIQLACDMRLPNLCMFSLTFTLAADTQVDFSWLLRQAWQEWISQLTWRRRSWRLIGWLWTT